MTVSLRRTLVAGISFAVLWGAGSAAHADQIVKIGHAAPLTGGIAHLGKDVENGARMAVDEINAAGLTIGGEKITIALDAQDDAGDPRTATQVAQKLLDDGVVAVVGHLQSGTSIPASKIYHDAGVVQITPGATNPAYTLHGFKTTFRVVATDAQQGPVLATYAAKTLGIKTVAIVDDSTAYGQGIADEFAKKAEALGIKVISRDATRDNAVDFRGVLTKIKGLRPDAIMYGGNDNTGGPFAKQALQLGLKLKVLGGDGICTDQLEKLAGKATDNVICSQAGMAVEKMPGGPAFNEKFVKLFKQEIQLDAPYAYDAVYIIVDAMKRANSTDRAKILEAMPQTNYKGVIGETIFDEKGDQKHGVISVFQYDGGKRKLLDVLTL